MTYCFCSWAVEIVSDAACLQTHCFLLCFANEPSGGFLVPGIEEQFTW